MLKTITSCPYCRAAIAVDATTGTIVFNPDGRNADPCPHLACFWVALSVSRTTPSGADCGDPARSCNRIWEFGRKIRDVDTRENWDDYQLTGWLCDYGFGELPLI